jgi:Ala-tRNA(Pro) deacylase
MAIAITLQEYLQNRDVDYEVIDHQRTDSTLRSSQAIRIKGDQMAKSVLLGDDESYLLAVVPASFRLRLREIERLTGRKLQLISEAEISEAFADCETGSIPPLGQVYGIETLLDRHLIAAPEIYFESGDHGKLIHMNSKTFLKLEEDALIAEIGEHI